MVSFLGDSAFAITLFVIFVLDGSVKLLLPYIVTSDKGVLIQIVGSRISALEAASIFDGCIAKDNAAKGKGLVDKILFWRGRDKSQSGDEARHPVS